MHFYILFNFHQHAACDVADQLPADFDVYVT